MVLFGVSTRLIVNVLHDGTSGDSLYGLFAIQGQPRDGAVWCVDMLGS